MRNFFFFFFIIIITLHAKTFRVSYDPEYEPFSYNINNKPYGLLIDIWKEWGKINHYDIKFVNGKTWNNAINLAKEGKVDYFLGTDPYAKWMKSSVIIYKTKTTFLGLKSSQKKDIDKIGIIGNDYRDVLLKEFGKSVKIISYDTYDELLKALIDKKVNLIYDDKIALTTLILQKRLNYLIGQKSGNIIIYSDIRAISNSNKNISIFNKGFQKIPRKDLLKIENNWIINQDDKYYKKNIDNFLTKKERDWLYRHPTSRIAIMSYWPHDEKGRSLHTEILTLINKYIGSNLVPVKFDTWKEGYKEAIKGDDIQGIMGLSWSKKREKNYFFYSPPYNFTPCYLIVKKNNGKNF